MKCRRTVSEAATMSEAAAAVTSAVLGADRKRCCKYKNQRNHCQTFHGYIVLLPLKTRAIYKRFGIGFCERKAFEAKVGAAGALRLPR
jgi:hypothetical protein